MNKLRDIIVISLVLGLSTPSLGFSSVTSRGAAIQEVLDGLRPPPEITPQEESAPSLFLQRYGIIDETLDRVQVEVALRIGYIAGSTTYDFNDHTSELMFPLGNWMGGASASVGFKNFSLNGEIWATMSEAVNSKMTDKDWINDALISSTESTEEMDGYIYDANLRYDFYNSVIPKNIDMLLLKASDGIKIGGLLGYRYERFDFDIYDVYYPDLDLMYYEGTKVLTYHIKYYLPYIGLATDILRKNFRFSLSLKQCLFPTAEHIDNHLLRGLTSFGDYDELKTGFMFRAEGEWNFSKRWVFGAGVDGTFVKLLGSNREHSGGAGWNQPMFTDLEQVLFWSGVAYRF